MERRATTSLVRFASRVQQSIERRSSPPTCRESYEEQTRRRRETSIDFLLQRAEGIQARPRLLDTSNKKFKTSTRSRESILHVIELVRDLNLKSADFAISPCSARRKGPPRCEQNRTVSRTKRSRNLASERRRRSLRSRAHSCRRTCACTPTSPTSDDMLGLEGNRVTSKVATNPPKTRRTTHAEKTHVFDPNPCGGCGGCGGCGSDTVLMSCVCPYDIAACLYFG